MLQSKVIVLAVFVAGQAGARVNCGTGLAGRNGRIVAIVGASLVGATGIAGVPIVRLGRTFLVSRNGVVITTFRAGLLLVAGSSAGGHGRDAGGGACCCDGGGSSLKAGGRCCGSVVTGRGGGFETGFGCG